MIPVWRRQFSIRDAETQLRWLLQYLKFMSSYNGLLPYHNPVGGTYCTNITWSR